MINKNNKAFSILEVIVGIFIFTMGIISVYGVIVSTLKLNEYNKNYIIASHLAREQIELVRNIRDSNYKKIKKYNQIDPNTDDFNRVFDDPTADKYYKIENNFSSQASFPIKVEEINNFGEGESNLTSKMPEYQLCLKDNIYTYCDNEDLKVPFYKYIKIERARDENGDLINGFKVLSKVIWYKKGYHEFELTSIFTDFKKF